MGCNRLKCLLSMLDGMKMRKENASPDPDILDNHISFDKFSA